MRRLWSFGGQIIVVADLKSVVVLLNLFLVLRLIRTDVGDFLPIRTPRELLHTVRCIADFSGLAAAHRQNENLRLGILPLTLVGSERQPVAAGRPSR